METSQNIGGNTTVDVSFWRDARTGMLGINVINEILRIVNKFLFPFFWILVANRSTETMGECLGEAMAQDDKILELHAQLRDAYNEVNVLLFPEVFHLESVDV